MILESTLYRQLEGNEMKYYLLRVESAGDFGDHAVIENIKERPLKISKFHYELDMWPTDDLLQAVGVFMVSEALAVKLKAMTPPITGASFDNVEVTTSAKFDEWHSNPAIETYRDKSKLPNYLWLKVSGTAGSDDLGLATNCLVISESVLDVMKSLTLQYCKVEEFLFDQKLQTAG